MKDKRNLKKKVKEDGKEVLIAKCQHCNNINKITLLKGVKPKFCMNCGKEITYSFLE
ncbi:MAG: hypothetical protein PHX70_08575 [Clostridium sp.]|nr:hypothetical protein [Clostridium sp.]